MPDILGNQIESQVPVAFQEQSYGAGSDPDSGHSDFHMYRRLGASNLDLPPITQQLMQQVSLWLFRRNPYAHRTVKIISAFAVGGGVRFAAENRKVDKILTEHWNHPINKWDWRVSQLTMELGLYGEIFQTANVLPNTGEVTWGSIDPIRVINVIPDERDMAQPAKIIVSKSPGPQATPSGDPLEFDVIRYDGAPNSDTHGFRVGEVLFQRTNGVLGALRGMSDLFPLSDYLDFIDQFVFSLQQRANFQNTFIWDVELQGKSDDDIKAWLNSALGQPPRPGSIRAHNERVSWKAEAPNLGATEAAEHLRLSRDYVLAGAGLAGWVMGDMSSANRAATESSAAVIMKTMEQRQAEIKSMIEDVFNFVIDVNIQQGNLPTKRGFNRTFYVSLPRVGVRDVQRIANAFRQAADGLQILSNMGVLDDERKIYLTNELINMLELEGSDRYAERDPSKTKIKPSKDAEDDDEDPDSDTPGRDQDVPKVSSIANKNKSRSRVR